MNSDTSIGPGPERGGNESRGNADGCGNKTLGEGMKDMPEAGAENIVGGEGAPDVPAPGGKPNAGIAKGPKSFPDGPNVESSPWELDAARGKLPPSEK